eukprot:gnl/Chilomastix_cuspidata/887.p1 GENE.gnl/Chilomastix_cuspidata/887~~gnl/Chilomastix_cuspidata/887.p1  ORF type:complete len:632 (+),score=111.41 gnl/Chilomastix_cuspidata/887:71-1966(+)
MDPGTVDTYMGNLPAEVVSRAIAMASTSLVLSQIQFGEIVKKREKLEQKIRSEACDVVLENSDSDDTTDLCLSAKRLPTKNILVYRTTGLTSQAKQHLDSQRRRIQRVRIWNPHKAAKIKSIRRQEAKLSSELKSLKKIVQLQLMDAQTMSTTHLLMDTFPQLIYDSTYEEEPPMAFTQKEFALTKAYVREHKHEVEAQYESRMLHLELAAKRELPTKKTLIDDCAAHQETESNTLDALAKLCAGFRTSALQGLHQVLPQTIPIVTRSDENAARAQLRLQHTVALDNLKHSTCLFKERLLRFSELERFDKLPQTHEGLRALNAIFQEFNGMSPFPTDFIACRGISSLQFVQNALEYPLKDIHGIGISTSAVVLPHFPGRMGDSGFSSVSDDGTVIFVARRKTNGELMLYNVFSQKTRMLVLPGIYWACSYRDEVFVGISGHSSIYYAPVRDVLKGLPWEKFQSFDVSGRIRSAATDTARRGWIAMSQDTCRTRLTRVNLATKTESSVDCDCPLSSLGSMSGIEIPGVFCVGTALSHGMETMAVFDDGRTKILSYQTKHFPTVLPSASEPTDLSKAAFIDMYGTMSYGDKSFSLTSPVKPAKFRTITRIYHDVFAIYDEMSWMWHALRISVP